MPPTAHAPALHFVMELRVEIAPPLELGEVRGQAHRVIPITGGWFAGPELRGKVLPGGADWQSTRQDRVAVLEARYTLRTDAGGLISVVNRGFRHGGPDLAARLAAGERVPPDQYYFMTAPIFETAVPELQWLSRTVFIGEALRHSDCVLITVWRVGDEPVPAAPAS